MISGGGKEDDLRVICPDWVRVSRGALWHFCFPPDFASRDAVMESVTADPREEFMPGKRNSHTILYHVPRTADMPETLIKEYVYKRGSRRLCHHKRYGRREFSAHLAALRLGFHSPRLFAYYEKTCGPLVFRSGIVMEYLPGFRSAPADRPELAADILADCCEKGLFCADLNMQNIGFVPGDPEPYLIDYEQSGITEKNSEKNLLSGLQSLFCREEFDADKKDRLIAALSKRFPQMDMARLRKEAEALGTLHIHGRRIFVLGNR